MKLDHKAKEAILLMGLFAVLIGSIMLFSTLSSSVMEITIGSSRHEEVTIGDGWAEVDAVVPFTTTLHACDSRWSMGATYDEKQLKIDTYELGSVKELEAQGYVVRWIKLTYISFKYEFGDNGAMFHDNWHYWGVFYWDLSEWILIDEMEHSQPKKLTKYEYSPEEAGLGEVWATCLYIFIRVGAEANLHTENAWTTLTDIVIHIRVHLVYDTSGGGMEGGGGAPVGKPGGEPPFHMLAWTVIQSATGVAGLALLALTLARMASKRGARKR